MEFGQDNREALDTLVDYMVTEGGWTIEGARDAVIIKWLESGDINPYCHFVTCGHTPSNKVARLLARMMIKGDAPEADGFNDLLFSLVLNGDMRKRPNQLAELRKFLAVRHSMILKEHHKKSGQPSYYDNTDGKAAKLAMDVTLGERNLSARTIRAAREKVERDLEAGRFPKILHGLISLK